MSSLFHSVKPGDMVHYSTPQGQYGKGKVVLRYDTHVVVNRGKGQPQVVNDTNYVKHERGGKVVGALLSKLAKHDQYTKAEKARKAGNKLSPYKIGEPQDNASKAFGWTKTNEDRSEAEGRASRVSKTKNREKAKKALHELNTATLASYVSKSIGDEKKQKHMADMAKNIHTPERSKYFVDKATAKAAKRHAGAKLAMKKIAKAYEETEVNEVSGALKKRYVAAATKDIGKSEGEAMKHGNSEYGNKMYDRAKKRYDGITKAISKKVNEAEGAAKARAGERSWTSDLADKSPNLAKGAGKPQAGYHYRVGGKTVSVHDHPQDALSAYKKGGSTGRIVHVKEGVETDVTSQMLSEDKVKQAAQKAIALSRKNVKGNKHVDTQPSLSLQDKGTNTPIEGSEQGERNDKL